MSHNREILSLIPEPIHQPTKRLGLGQKLGILGASALSFTLAACNENTGGDSNITTAPQTQATESVKPQPITPDMIMSRIHEQQTGQIKDLISKYVGFIQPETITIALEEVELNTDPIEPVRFSQRANIFSNTNEQILEASNSYNPDGEIISSSVLTERKKISSSTNTMIDRVIATEGLFSPKLPDLYRELLTYSFNFPAGVIDCFTSTTGVAKNFEAQYTYGLSTVCEVQIDQRWEFEASINPLGDIQMHLIDKQGMNSKPGHRFEATPDSPSAQDRNQTQIYP